MQIKKEWERNRYNSKIIMLRSNYIGQNVYKDLLNTVQFDYKDKYWWLVASIKKVIEEKHGKNAGKLI